MIDFLTLNGRKFYFAELLDGSFRETSELDGYEDKTLEFCALWLAGTQEFTLTTSGTTGKPKQVTLTRQQMQASAKLTASTLGLKKNDRALACLNTEFIAGMMMIVRALELELELTIVNPVANPMDLLGQEAAFEFAAVVPYQLAAMMEQPEHLKVHFQKAKAVMVGGGPVPVSLEERLQGLPNSFYATYGSTETATHIGLRKLNGNGRSDFFMPLNGVTVGLDERGCLWSSGPMTNDQQIASNDLAEVQPDGSFRILGRMDRVINSGGIKVHPELIEKVVEVEMKLLGLHQEFRIIGAPHDQLGEAIILELEGHSLTTHKKSDLMNQLQNKLPAYQVPKAIRYVPNFPRTATGKISL